MEKLKQIIHDSCRDFLNEKISKITSALAELQEAANSETKSSVGDKYETGRAMMQLEIEKLGAQLLEWKKTKEELESIDSSVEKSRVEKGALVICSNGNFYIAAACGKFIIEGKTYYAVSTEAPLVKEILGKTVGKKGHFNGKTVTIMDIE